MPLLSDFAAFVSACQRAVLRPWQAWLARWLPVPRPALVPIPIRVERGARPPVDRHRRGGA